jgi:DNA-binding NtrC family response regulator
MSQNRILLVHSEASVRALLNSMLRTLGCHIEEASNDRVAVRRLDQAPVDLVLAACEPADPEALELLAYLHRKHPKVPCVLLFAAPHPEQERVALNWGAASVLRYPLPANALRAAVAQALGLTEPALSAAPRPTAAPHAAYAIAAAPAGSQTTAHALTDGPAAAGPPEFAEVVGNVLELENAVERAVVHCRGARIEPCHLELNRRRPEQPAARPGHAAARPSVAGILRLKEALEGPERQLILEALEALNWNRQETARALDINRTTLYKKMKKYDVLVDEPAWAN